MTNKQATEVMIMQQPTEPGRPMPAESFPTDPTGLPEAARPPVLAGRFLVLARDQVAEPNLVWKDTVLVRTGQTVDILFAEQMQSGMMFSFTVARKEETTP